MRDLHKNSYDILKNRITDRGYAVTSLTGLYVGMFPRDSSIQVMAHLSSGDTVSARKILRYLLSYHTFLDLKHTAHIIEEIKDEDYGNTYLSVEYSCLDGYFIAQRGAEKAIYLLNAPNNRASQSFVPVNDRIYGVEVNLSKTYDTDKVTVLICREPMDESSALARAEYTFGDSPSGWQRIYFNAPVKLNAGKEYYIMIVASEDSGNVVWNGSTRACGENRSYNYDYAVFGTWEIKQYALAFEVLSCPEDTVAKQFIARSNKLIGVQISVCSNIAGAKLGVEICGNDLYDPKRTVANTEIVIRKNGKQDIFCEFKEPIALQKDKDYHVIITFPENRGYCKVISDSRRRAPTVGYDRKRKCWDCIGYNLLVEPVFDMDIAPLYDALNGGFALQKIPTKGEIITAVSLLLSKSQGACGEICVSLCKGNPGDLQVIDMIKYDVSEITPSGKWISFVFDLPLVKIRQYGDYYIKLEGKDVKGSVYWCGSRNKNTTESFVQQNNELQISNGVFSFEAFQAEFGLISNFMQTDANYMLIHAWCMYVNSLPSTVKDREFISASYPIIKRFAEFFTDDDKYYNAELDLILNPSLEHSRLGRYWIAYDLITNVFASQALFELSGIAGAMNDFKSSEKFREYSEKLKMGIEKNLTTEFEGKRIYAEFYDVEDNMKLYRGISWVNLAPIAAEWYGVDMQIMKNTYEIFKKYGSVNMYGYGCLASEVTLGTNDITKEMIGKCIAWEMMLCKVLGDEKRLAEIIRVELETAARNGNTVYPECWRNEDYITDPGNQEHCAWQVYAVNRVYDEYKL